MHDHRLCRLWHTVWVVVLLMAAGCFQPAGGGLEATSILQAQPTFTPFPSDTAIPMPTETPAEFFPAQLLDVSTPVAMLPENQDLDPFWQTATAQYLLGLGQPLDVVPLDQPTLDPLLASATVMVREATETAAFPLTQTAQAMGGFPTATFDVFQPTWTLSGPVVVGTDCVYEVQATDRNLYRISLLFGIPYMDIAQKSNLINPNLIHVGDKLIIPGCGVTGYQPPPTSMPTFQAGTQPAPGGSGTYVVQAGDTLFALSLSWGTTVSQIAAINQIANVNLIYVGQTLTIP